mgnify:CR=1 FL=1
MSKLHIKKGDTVYVNAGNDKGKTGRVLSVLVSKNKAIVEGINVVSKSAKPSAKHPQGGIIKMEAPVHVSNLTRRAASRLASDARKTKQAKQYVIQKNQERRLSNEQRNS